MKHNEPISEVALKEMKTGKVYHFHFNNKYVYKVRIENINDTTVSGTIKSVFHEQVSRGEDPVKDKFMNEKEREPFTYRYGEILESTNEITTLKLNPYLTAIPVGFILFTTIYLIVDPLY